MKVHWTDTAEGHLDALHACIARADFGLEKGDLRPKMLSIGTYLFENQRVGLVRPGSVRSLIQETKLGLLA